MKVKNSLLRIGLVMLIVGVLVSAGCTTAAPAATPAPTAQAPAAATKAAPAATTPAAAAPAATAPAATPASSGDVIPLRFSFYSTTTSDFYKPMAAMAEAVEKETNGKVKITIYPNASLGPAADQYKMVAQGVVDMSFHSITYSPGVFPMTELVALPLTFKSETQSAQALNDISEQYLLPEFKDVQPLSLMVFGANNVFTTKKQVKTLEDLKGLKIAVTGAVPVETMKALGVAPVAIAVNERYEALERGTVDGTAMPASGIYNVKFQTVVKYGALADLWGNVFVVSMNKDKWNQLPADAQAAIKKHTGKTLATSFNEVNWAAEVAARAKLANDGITGYDVPADEKARWAEAVSGIAKAKIAELEAKGIPAQKTYDALVAAAAAHP